MSRCTSECQCNLTESKLNKPLCCCLSFGLSSLLHYKYIHAHTRIRIPSVFQIILVGWCLSAQLRVWLPVASESQPFFYFFVFCFLTSFLLFLLLVMVWVCQEWHQKSVNPIFHLNGFSCRCLVCCVCLFSVCRSVGWVNFFARCHVFFIPT
jgi:hypothetical protein